MPRTLLYIILCSTYLSLHAAQVHVEMKKHEEKQLSQEEQEAVDQMFEIVVQAKWPNRFNNIPDSEKALQNLFLKYPAIVNQKNQNCSSLMLAAALNLPNIARFLITGGANLNEVPVTPLMIAAAYGHKEMLRLLIAEGADQQLQNSHGETAIEIATKKTLRDEYVNAVKAGEEERREFLHKEIGQYLIRDLAKIVVDYADKA